MAIPMPKVFHGKCEECQTITEYYFNQYGAIEPCDFCQAAPIKIQKVKVSEME
jgi:hypothetical protein